MIFLNSSNASGGNSFKSSAAFFSNPCPRLSYKNSLTFSSAGSFAKVPKSAKAVFASLLLSKAIVFLRTSPFNSHIFCLWTKDAAEAFSLFAGVAFFASAPFTTLARTSFFSLGEGVSFFNPNKNIIDPDSISKNNPNIRPKTAMIGTVRDGAFVLVKVEVGICGGVIEVGTLLVDAD